MIRSPLAVLTAASTAALVACHAAPAPPAARPLAAPRVVPGAPDVTKLLGDTPARALTLGAGPLSIVASGLVTEGERIGAFVEVPDDACLLVYARGASSVEDLDLVALTDEGSPIALDESPDPKPTVLVCPPHPRRFYVALQVAQGEGLAVAVAHVVPRPRAKALGVALGARGALGAPKRTDDWPYLDDVLREHRRVIGGVWEETKRIAVPVDTHAPSFTAISGGPSECLDVLLVPDDDVGLIDADLADAEGRQVARARGSAETRSLVVCTDGPLAGSLRLRSHVGQGSVAVVVSRAAAGYAREARARPEFALHGVAVPVAEAEKLRADALSRAGYGRAKSIRKGQLAASKITSVSAELSADCSRIDLVAGEPVRRALLEAWSPAGELLGAGEGASGAVTYVCAKGRVRLDLESRGAGGPFSLEVRPATWTGPELAAAPLAGSRMLSRASSGQHELFEGTNGALRALTLTSTSLATFAEEVAPSTCLRAFAGTEGGQGLELRLFDATSGEELDRAHGESSGVVGACARTAPMKVRFEARTITGTSKAIVGLRKTP